MRQIISGLALVLACSTAPPIDEYGWYVDGVLSPDEPCCGHDGPFLAKLIITDQPDELYEFWKTKPGNVPVRHIEKAAPGTHVEAVVFFARCQPDREGNCMVWGSATVVASDGRVLANGVEVPLWVGHPPPPGMSLGISEHGVGIAVDSFSGSYTVSILVTDRIAGREVRVVRELTVVASE